MHTRKWLEDTIALLRKDAKKWNDRPQAGMVEKLLSSAADYYQYTINVGEYEKEEDNLK